MIGSVHLAYHYAVDGYVSIAVTLIIWWMTKPIARWILKPPVEVTIASPKPALGATS